MGHRFFGINGCNPVALGLGHSMHSGLRCSSVDFRRQHSPHCFVHRLVHLGFVVYIACHKVLQGLLRCSLDGRLHALLVCVDWCGMKDSLGSCGTRMTSSPEEGRHLHFRHGLFLCGRLWVHAGLSGQSFLQPIRLLNLLLCSFHLPAGVLVLALVESHFVLRCVPQHGLTCLVSSGANRTLRVHVLGNHWHRCWMPDCLGSCGGSC